MLMTNLMVDANAVRDLDMLKTAKAAGYDTVAINDSKFQRWSVIGSDYQAKARKFRDAVRKLGMKFVIGVCPIGYSNDLLSLDPNLAEGLPVRDATYRATEQGTLVPDDAIALQNGGFEMATGDTPGGWAWLDDPGKVCFIDRSVFHDGSQSLRMENTRDRNGRAVQALKLRPFQNYHLSAWVKTEGFDAAGSVDMKVLAGERSLQAERVAVEPTMDWRRVDVTFNSLENTDANLYLGVWGGGSGKLWWDDVRIEPAGLMNVLRRSSTPVVIESADGSTTFAEGKDFTDAVDPKMGNIAYPGDYNAWHEPPILRVPAGSRIRPGQALRVSFTHVAMVGDSQVNICVAEPKTRQLLAETITELHEGLDPDGYFLSHDEIRAMGYDPACVASGKPPGQLLAENVAWCAKTVREKAPGKPVYVWSDMFDPYHNAADKGFYYLVKGDGPYRGSWNGLDPKITVVNWNSSPEQRVKSMRFFAERGNAQILAGYYDGPVGDIQGWLRDAQGIRGISGVMYTTWVGQFRDLKAFIKALGKGLGN